jgi:hypothetical protein
VEPALPPILAAYRARLADLDVAVKADDTLLSEADIAVQERLPQSEKRVGRSSVKIDQSCSSTAPHVL